MIRYVDVEAVGSAPGDALPCCSPVLKSVLQLAWRVVSSSSGTFLSTEFRALYVVRFRIGTARRYRSARLSKYLFLLILLFLCVTFKITVGHGL